MRIRVFIEKIYSRSKFRVYFVTFKSNQFCKWKVKKCSVILKEFLVVKILLSSVSVCERENVYVYFFNCKFCYQTQMSSSRKCLFLKTTDDFLMRQCRSCPKNHTETTNAIDKNFIEHF